jgi:Tol biopolymer transport system component
LSEPTKTLGDNVKVRSRLAAVPLAAVLGAAVMAAPAQGATGVELASVSSSGEVGGHHSSGPSLSATGRFVVFRSDADNLVPGGPFGFSQAYLRDREINRTELISLASNGGPANSYAGPDSISADGRYVAFSTDATNILPGLTTQLHRSYLRDRQAGTTSLITANSQGEAADAYSWSAQLSADGRFAAFASVAKNLVPGDTNSTSDVFVRDIAAGTTERVSLGDDESQRPTASGAPAISRDGRFVTFIDERRTFDHARGAAFLRDRQNGTTEEVSLTDTGQAPARPAVEGPAEVSADGRYVAFNSRSDEFVAGDTNGRADIFVRDRVSARTERVSFNTDGTQTDKDSGGFSMTSDGQRVAFARIVGKWPPGAGPQEIFVWKRQSKTVRKVTSDGNAVTGSNYPSVSDDGKKIAFQSSHPFVANDTNGILDIYVRLF